MKEMKKGGCTARNCPCYPNCDQMMTDDWMVKQTESVTLHQLDTNQTELMKLIEHDEKDLEKLEELYPARIRKILMEVEKVCDSMEYEGSVMFDELPEKQRILDLRDGILEKIEPQLETWEQEMAKQQEEDIYVMDHHMDASQISQAYPPQPPYPPRPPYPPQHGGRNDWLGDLVQVLLQEEMYHRRCRRRNCRRW